MVWAGVDGRVYIERGESASLAGRPASHVARWGRGTARFLWWPMSPVKCSLGVGWEGKGGGSNESIVARYKNRGERSEEGGREGVSDGRGMGRQRGAGGQARASHHRRERAKEKRNDKKHGRRRGKQCCIAFALCLCSGSGAVTAGRELFGVGPTTHAHTRGGAVSSVSRNRWSEDPMHRSIERDVLYVLLTYWLRWLRSREEDRSIESSRVDTQPHQPRHALRILSKVQAGRDCDAQRAGRPQAARQSVHRWWSHGMVGRRGRVRFSSS